MKRFPSQIGITDALAKDKPFLIALNRLVYEELVQSVFGKWDDKKQLEYFEDRWRKQKVQILKLHDRPIGTICVSEDAKSIFLHEIQIHPNYQNRGIGSYLIGEQMRKATLNQKSCALRVLRANVNAVSLYRRIGFMVVEEETNYFIMKFSVMAPKEIINVSDRPEGCRAEL